MSSLLYDKDFLLQLDKQKNKIIYARITSLQFNESPVDTIEGRVTGGSINIDGASAVRRTCSLTLVAQDFDYKDYYWGLNTKFKLEIGVQNTIDTNLPDIIWFDQGIYLVTSFNTSRSINNFTISLSGKDKMCLLNGEVGGSIESSVDFGVIEEEDINGNWTIRSLPIQEIIRNIVHTYGGEPYWNISINDLDTYGLELLEYRYDTPMYLYRSPDSNIFYNVIMENKNTVVYYEKNDKNPIHLYDIDAAHLDVLVDSLTDDSSTEALPVYVKKDNQYYPYIFAKVTYGQTAGYRMTDLVYAGDLIANVGDSITSILDKIRNMLTEFEYFYDIDGRFVFQKKKSFISTMWSPLVKNEITGDESVIGSLMTSSSTAYTFSGGELITSFNNSPNLLNMRNDFSIWGERTGASGAAIPVHMRYAIDKKPLRYTQITVENNNEQIVSYNEKYQTLLKGNTNPLTFTTQKNDLNDHPDWILSEWREVIYQMASDYYKYNILDDFELRLIKSNPWYHTGQTGYEKYYIDMQGFWRQLYYPGLEEIILKLEKTTIPSLTNNINSCKNEILSLEQSIRSRVENLKTIVDDILRIEEEQKLNNDRQNLFSKQNILRNYEIELEESNIELEKLITEKEQYYYPGQENYVEDRKYWNKNVYEAPELLNFWFDFLDTEGELQQFSVKNVGFRSKSINDTAIKSIYFRETPEIVFTDNINKENKINTYRYIQIPNDLIDTMFSISAQGKSAKNKLDELIYNHGYCIENATIVAIPVYYLEPNVRIYLHDEETGLDGDYVVSKITLPLTYNGMMNITATKAAENII